jgi:hypothetical protein
MTLARALVVIVATTAVAHAQSAPAEALFRDGRTLIKQGKLEAGCDKLAASEKLESSVGTLLNLGDCREKLGKTATAWAAFRKAEAMAKRDGNDKRRQAEAKRRADKLEGNLPQLVLQAGKATPNLVIRRDGLVLDAATLNTPLPVDPGTHVIVAEAPGFRPYRTEVTISRGGKRYVVIPTLEPVPEPVAATPPPPPPPAAVAPTVTVQPPPRAPSVVVDSTPRYVTTHSTWSGTRKAAVVVGVLGAAAVAGGAYFAVHANDLQSRSDELCPADVCNIPEALDLNDDAQTSATRANILLIGGGAAIAAATVMWFVGGPEERTVIAPAVSSDSVGASVAGRF